MRERNKARAAGRTPAEKTKHRQTRDTEVLANGDDVAKKDMRKKENRQGTCSKCGEHKWLLRKDPPTCTLCYRGANSEPKGAKVSRKKKTRRKQTQHDDLSMEVAAIEGVSLSLEGLSPEAVRRVIGYSLARYTQTEGVHPSRLQLPMLTVED